jgi:pimeloyl-ACP methyl ester carboxylesterase
VASGFTPFHRGGSGPPLVCLHGFTDTWRTWELVLPALEARHDVFAPTLIGHAGGPPLDGPVDDDTIVDALERALDDAGIETAQVVGNSLGGFLALQLAARGRASSVVALAPAGGWAPGDGSFRSAGAYFTEALALAEERAARADEIASTPEGRRETMKNSVVHTDHLPADLVAHEIRGVAFCDGAAAMLEHAGRDGWRLDVERVTCPVRIVWGTADQILPWPAAADRYRNGALPQADWVMLDGIGHCPQLDSPDATAAAILDFTAHS